MIVALYGYIMPAETPGYVIIRHNDADYIAAFSENEVDGFEKVLIHHEFLENGQQKLYAFLEPAVKRIFMELIKVNGVGCSTAMQMLRSASPAAIATAIARGDIKFLQTIKGIGKKTAEQICLDLGQNPVLSSMARAEVDMPEPHPNDNQVVASVARALEKMGAKKGESLRLALECYVSCPTQTVESVTRLAIQKFSSK